MAKVLVVDDEAAMRDTMRRFLEKEGHEVLVAAEAMEATHLLQAPDFDVVISDIVMPRISGVELLNTINEISPFTKVIMITGEPNLDTSVAAVRSGAFDYLSKPVDRSHLCSTVAKAAKFKALEDENRRHNDSLEIMVRDRTEKLQRVLEQTANALGAAMEMRDSYTAGHQRRVTDLACSIARELEYPTTHMEGLRIAGLLHDIGKLNIPAEILIKPTRLSDAEFTLIKGHSQAGHDILKEIEFERPIAQIVLQHHERIDGSGYPNGLSGDDILLEAKIIAVADVVEAMASHRPYRAALGIDMALEEITDKRGTQFDPDVADACLRLFKMQRFDWES